jgi:caa(3)-type oxidase subunit IV
MSAHAKAHGHHTNYVKIYWILLGLLVVSVIGPELNIRVVTLITAFGVALVKAYMVAKYFMHLDVEKPIIHYALGLALLLMVLLYAGIVADVGRDAGERWVKGPGWHYHGESSHAAGGAHGGDGHGTTGH